MPDPLTLFSGFRVRDRERVGQPLEEIAYLELGGTVIELMSVKDAGSSPSDP